jgi:hypothetical protein
LIAGVLSRITSAGTRSAAKPGDWAAGDASIVKINPSSRIKDITFEGGSLT